MQNMLSEIFADWRVNKGNAKARVVLFLFRIASAISRVPKPLQYIGYPYVVFYKILIEWILGIELPWKTVIGKGLRIHHGQSLVVNDKCIIGEYCLLRHSTTIGVSSSNNFFEGKAPKIGNNVDIGAGAIIIGDVIVGNNVKIGAGSVVVKSVPDGAVVVGNPARIISGK